MRKFISLATALLLPFFAWAEGNISGTVVSKSSGEPIEFAVIQLVSEKTGQPTSIGAYTDEYGKFILNDVPDGKYSVLVTLIGNVPQSRPVVIKGANKDVGTIHLAEDTQLLKEVVVEGIKGQMRFELDKKVFNVDADIASAGASASELLESVPSIEVDQDGEVSLRGNTSVTIWLNGRESGLTAENRAQILEQIPAETIDRIEVITNPSAKYSPEGTAGIINIILKKDRRNGYYGSADLGANTHGGANLSGNINFNVGKWESYAGIGFRMRHPKGGSRSNRQYNDSDYFLKSEGINRNHGSNFFLRLGTTYHLTDNDDIYANAFGMYGRSWGGSTTDYESNLPSHWISNKNTSNENGENFGGHIELGYTHRWNDNHTLDINGAFNHWGGPRMSDYMQEMMFEDSSTSSEYQEQEMTNGSNSGEVKIDYVNQFTDWLKLEAGYNGNFGKQDSPVTTWDGPTEADKQLNEDLYNRFIYENYINAAYFTFGGKVNQFSFSAGLRAEQWHVRTKSLAYGQIESDVPEYKKNNFALFPSAYLSYALPKDNEIQINYTRRIRRPWGGQLNSFKNISNPTNISYGNPELLPQYANAFELNYIKSWTYHIISLSAFLRSTERDMNRISYLGEEGVMYTTWANVGTTTNAGVEIVGKNSFFGNVLDLTTTLNLYNSHVSAWNLRFEDKYEVKGNARNDFAWDVRCMASVKLPWQLSFQATGRYNSSRIMAQGSREASWSLDAGIRKIFGNWSISLNCRDILDSRKMHSITIGEEYMQENERWRGGRRLQLSVKFSFGNMMAKPSKRDMEQGEPMDGGGFEGGEEF